MIKALWIDHVVNFSNSAWKNINYLFKKYLRDTDCMTIAAYCYSEMNWHFQVSIFHLGKPVLTHFLSYLSSHLQHISALLFLKELAVASCYFIFKCYATKTASKNIPVPHICWSHPSVFHWIILPLYCHSFILIYCFACSGAEMSFK